MIREFMDYWIMKTMTAVTALGALAHEGRLDLFRRLVRAGEEGIAAGDLARAAGLRLTTSSAQLGVLAQAGLVASRREGRSIIYSADYGAITGLIAFLMKDCCQGRAEVVGSIAELANEACRAC